VREKNERIEKKFVGFAKEENKSQNKMPTKRE
jgi:hypothetical protein